MKNFYMSAIIFFLGIVVANSQTTLIADFEEGQNSTHTGSFYGWGDGNLLAVQNPEKDGVNDSEYALKKTLPEGQRWGAVALWNNEGVDLFKDEYEYLKIDLFIPDGDSDISEVTITIKGQNSESGGSDFESTPQSVSSAGEWHQIIFNLNEVSVFDYQQLGIQVDDNDFGAFYVDNIYWATESTSVADNSLNLAIVSSEGAVILYDAFYENIEVYSLSGVKVYEAFVESSPYRINLPQGVYVVKQDNGFSSKVIVR